jgi:hypothetical protein
MGTSAVICQSFPARIRSLVLGLGVLALSGCAFWSPSPKDKSAWLPSGSIVIARRAPAPSAAEFRALGFSASTTPNQNLAIAALQRGTWLDIDRTLREARVMEGEKVIDKIQSEDLFALTPGSYQVVHKQRNPLWYASDDYFSRRNQEIPLASAQERYRRGALGDYVIFIDERTPLHDAPLKSPEVGGARLAEKDIAKIFYRLDTGARVVVR